MEQHENKAGGDLAGGNIDKSRQYFLGNSKPANKKSRITLLYEKLEDEIKNDIKIDRIIDDLQHFQQARTNEDVIGIEAKLKAGERENFIDYALDAKEYYTKKIWKYQLYESAQKINVYLLALVQTYFVNKIYPLICRNEDPILINELVVEKIVNPLLDELADDTLGFSSKDIEGMLYFLTGNCHIKWNK
jgi:hypothetical protein